MTSREELIKDISKFETHCGYTLKAFPGCQEELADFILAREQAKDAIMEEKERRIKELGGGWISVEDRLPYNGEKVVVYDKIEFGVDSFHITYFYPECYFGRIHKNVSHWMPLPKPPTEAK